jgi:hypothetical protein
MPPPWPSSIHIRGFIREQKKEKRALWLKKVNLEGER